MHLCVSLLVWVCLFARLFVCVFVCDCVCVCLFVFQLSLFRENVLVDMFANVSKSCLQTRANIKAMRSKSGGRLNSRFQQRLVTKNQKMRQTRRPDAGLKHCSQTTTVIATMTKKHGFQENVIIYRLKSHLQQPT